MEGDLATHFVNGTSDLMTPPDVLLSEWLVKSKEYTRTRKEEALDGWIKCNALARIVHGDTHWMLAMTNIQLGQEYMKRGLNEQALIHATKGRDILLTPTSHVMSHDPPPEAVYNLSLSHYIIAHVQTTQKKLRQAERALVSAEETSKHYSRLSSDKTGSLLDLDITSACGRLQIELKNYSLAKKHFQKAVDLSKSVYGAQNSHLVALLRGLASAVLRGGGDKATAVTALEESLRVAESSFGANSEEVGDSLMSLGRAHVSDGAAEEYFQRAHTVYVRTFDEHHPKAVECKDELCRYLATKPESQERVVPLLKELIAEKKVAYGENSLKVGESLKLLGTLQLTLKEVKQATRSLTKAKAVYTAVLGAKHKETLNIAETLDIIAGSGDSRTGARPIFKTTV